MAAALSAWGIPVVIPHRQASAGTEAKDARLGMAAWVADQAVAITAAQVLGPLILVSSGPANAGLAALGFSQRAARRSVVAYVLLGGPLPDPSRAGTDWPDAPVLYVANDPQGPGASAARLRGWTILDSDPIAAVSGIARGWPDSLS
jgi:hypothetical protein